MKRILALTGGGVRGCMHLGALQGITELTGEQQLYKIFSKGIYGISIGAIVGSMVGFGVPTHRILQHSSLFTESRSLFDFRSITSVFGRNGISTGEAAHEMIRTAFAKEGLDLDSLYVHDSLVPLHILATDVHQSRAVRFGGSVKLWDALRASFSLPILFTPHTIGRHSYVDAACLIHTPFPMINHEQREETLLLALTKKPSEVVETDLAGFMFRVMSLASIHETQKYARKYPDNVCLIEESTITMTQSCTEEEIQYMIGVGRTAIMQKGLGFLDCPSRTPDTPQH